MEKSYLRKKVGIMQKFKILCMFFIKSLCYLRLFFMQKHLFCTVFKHIIPFFLIEQFSLNPYFGFNRMTIKVAPLYHFKPKVAYSNYH